MSALKQRIIARRTQFFDLISYLHKGLEDGIRNSNLLSFNFPRASPGPDLTIVWPWGTEICGGPRERFSSKHS